MLPDAAPGGSLQEQASLLCWGACLLGCRCMPGCAPPGALQQHAESCAPNAPCTSTPKTSSVRFLSRVSLLQLVLLLAVNLKFFLEDAIAVAGHEGGGEEQEAAAAAVRAQVEALSAVGMGGGPGAAAPACLTLLVEVDGAQRTDVMAAALRRLLPQARSLAGTLLRRWWTLPSQAAAGEAAALARASAARSCAFLKCPNLAAAGQGGPAAGAGTGSKRCSACRAARYCSAACQLADWKQGGGLPHKRTCAMLAAERRR